VTFVKVAPSLLSADFGRLAEAVSLCEAGRADAIHFDVMDGRFVPSLTVGPLVLSALRKATSLPFDVHLMIEEPMRTLGQYLDAGASRVAVHVEAEPHMHRFAADVRARNASPGVAVNPGTSLSTLDEALDFVDFVLVMSVDPGWGGQTFLPRSLERVKALREHSVAIGRTVEVAVDGGVSPRNAGDLASAGASWLVAGSAVFGRGDIAGAIAEIRRAAQGLPKDAGGRPS
jgi:ribulose-phosphate 3-epimerase